MSKISRLLTSIKFHTEVFDHINAVRKNLIKVANLVLTSEAFTKDVVVALNPYWQYDKDQLVHILLKLAVKHDASKLDSSELSLWLDLKEKWPNKPAYATSEYTEAMSDARTVLDVHYNQNSHHPEFFYPKGIHGMTVVDQLEMLCDWKAASEAEGRTLYQSIQDNQKRFGYSEERKAIFILFDDYLSRV